MPGMLDDLGATGHRPIVPPKPTPGADLEVEPVGIEHIVAVEWRIDGKVLRGEFVHRVPTQAERRTIDRLVARALEGMPRACFTDQALFALERDASIAVCYADRVPAWFKVDDCRDPRLLGHLYEEGLNHMSRFLGRSGDPSKGAEEAPASQP